MDQIKTGALIRTLRTKCGLTQKQLAEKLNISDKAVSKWECGNGSPDISILTELVNILGTDVRTLLSGEINCNEREVGNMNKIRFYVCGECGNMSTSTSEASVTCCGNKLAVIEPHKASEHERLKIENTGGELYITSGHEMTKEHFISFAAYQNDNTLMIFKQYPEWTMQARLPLLRSGRLVWYCNKCGLLWQPVREQ